VNPLVLGLLIGMAFGAILTLSGLSDPRGIVDMLRLKDLRLFKLLVVAIGTGMVGIALLDAAGSAHTSIKALHVLAIAVGAVIFGLGFAVTGYCPGTSLAAAAQGRRDAYFTVAGGLTGAAIHAWLYAWMLPRLVEPLSFGKPTLPAWLGLPALAVALPLGAVLLGLAFRWRRKERGSGITAQTGGARFEREGAGDARPTSRA
jgi:uncharacterized membrane protein YedE/YeeE